MRIHREIVAQLRARYRAATAARRDAAQYGAVEQLSLGDPVLSASGITVAVRVLVKDGGARWYELRADARGKGGALWPVASPEARGWQA